MNNYKQMIYDKNQHDSVMLAQDFYKGYEFFVISLGMHPCAYVRLKQMKFDNYDDYSEKVKVHYGFTYLRTILYVGNHKNIQDNNGFLGWDYGHCEDYEAYYNDNGQYKKWTTEEMVNECKNVIDQLIEIEKEKSKLTDAEKCILKSIDNINQYNYITRDKNGAVWLFEDRPIKNMSSWNIDSICAILEIPFTNLFTFIKWEDEEPYKIEELLRDE